MSHLAARMCVLQAARLAGVTSASLRTFASQQGDASLKAALRELYKRVHPDTFHGEPAAVRAANERSFVLLQDWLEAARGGGGGIGRTAGLPYHFNFFVRQAGGEVLPQAEPLAADAAGAPPLLEGLREVTLTLPPPPRGGPGGDLAPAARKALATLLDACGLAGQLEGGAGGTGDRRFSRLTSLRDFLPAAAEALHQAAASHSGPRQALAAVRTALRLGRGAALVFGGSLAGAGVLAQLPPARQLAGVLDGEPGLDLRGLVVVLGAGYGTDPLGRISLSAEGSAEAWSSFLTTLDLGACRQRQALLAAVRAQEGEAAAALGVSLVHAPPHLTTHPDYRALLEGVAAAALGGRRPVPGVRDAAVLVEGEAQRAQRDGEAGGAAAPPPPLPPGVVSVGLGESGAAAFNAVESAGPAAAAAARARREEDAALADLQRRVERTLRLRRLGRAAALPPDRFRAGCLRLLAHSREVGPLMDGLAVEVGEAGGLAPDASCILIPWDFVV